MLKIRKIKSILHKNVKRACKKKKKLIIKNKTSHVCDNIVGIFKNKGYNKRTYVLAEPITKTTRLGKNRKQGLTPNKKEEE